MRIGLKPLVHGIVTYVPPVERLFSARVTRGTDSARYCYAVWMRHLAMAHASGLNDNPRVVAELGPGDSLGIGLTALLTGASEYVGLDVVDYPVQSRNFGFLDEIAALLRARTPIPDATEFPDVKPYLDSYDFPRDILTDARLDASLKPARVDAIREALTRMNQPGGEISIRYHAPWLDPSVLRRESIDMVYSQAVLEHVDDLEPTYAALAAWLKPGGSASHQIGFYSHRLTAAWNGHWAISDLVWKIMRGKRPFLLNREPASTHVQLLAGSGLRIVNERRVTIPSDITRAELAPRFRSMSDADLTTKSVFLQAVKPHAQV